MPEAPRTPTYSEWYSPWQTADGWVGAIWPSDEQYVRVCGKLGVPHLADDPRFATREARIRNSNEHQEVFAKLLGEFTTADALKALEEADVPCAPVLDITEVFDDPQVKHNETVLTHHHPVIGQVRTARFPARFSKTPTQVERLAPTKGEHTDDVLTELGRSGAEIAALRNDGIVA